MITDSFSCSLFEKDMGALSLLIGFYHIALLIGPIVNGYITAIDESSAIQIYFIWVFAYLRGLGYDLLSHGYGLEASAWIFLFELTQTFSLIKLNTLSYSLWIFYAGFSVMYLIVSRTPYYKYIAESWGNANEKVIANDKGLKKMSKRNIALLVGFTLLYNVIRVALRFTTLSVPVYQYQAPSSTPVPDIDLSNPIPSSIPSPAFGFEYKLDPSSALSSSTGATSVPVPLPEIGSWEIDETAAYTAIVEMGLAFVFTLRVPSMVNLERTSDFWATGGGVYLAYLYLQGISFVTLANGRHLPEVIAVSICLAILVIVILMIDYQVSGRHEDGKNQEKTKKILSIDRILDASFASVWRILFPSIRDIFRFLCSEPICIVLFLLCNFIVFYSLDYSWYTTNVGYGNFIRSVACPIVSFIENPLREFYTITSSEILQSFIMPLVPTIGIYRAKGVTIGNQLYPYINQGCRGAITTFIPSKDVIALVFLVLPILPAVVVSFSSFPEAAYFVRRPNFWFIALLLSTFSLMVSQCASDVTSTAWSFIYPETEFERVYTDTGRIVLVCQLTMIMSCMFLYYQQHRDMIQAEEKKRGTGASVLGAIVRTPEKLYDLFVRPSTLLFVAATAMATYVIMYGGSPFTNIEIIDVKTNPALPWLVATKYDKVGVLVMSLVKLFGRNALILYQLFHLVLYLAGLLDGIGQCIGWEGFRVCLTVGGIIRKFIGGVVPTILGWLMDAFEFVARVVVLPIIAKLLPGSISIDRFDDLLQQMNMIDVAFDFDLIGLLGVPRFQIPSWIPIVGIVFLVFMVLLIVAGFFSDTMKPAGHALVCTFVSFLLSFLVLLVKLWSFLAGLSKTASIELNSTANLYMLAILMYCIAAIFVVLEELRPSNASLYTAARVKDMNQMSITEQSHLIKKEDNGKKDTKRDVIEMRWSVVKGGGGGGDGDGDEIVL